MVKVVFPSWECPVLKSPPSSMSSFEKGTLRLSLFREMTLTLGSEECVGCVRDSSNVFVDCDLVGRFSDLPRQCLARQVYLTKKWKTRLPLHNATGVETALVLLVVGEQENEACCGQYLNVQWG